MEYFQAHDNNEIPDPLVYYLSVIPWHPDMLLYKDSHTPESREYGKTLIKKFEKKDVIKLLHFVDEENMVSRGSLGQSVEAIVSFIPDFTKHLDAIITDKGLDIRIREVAAVIYAYHHGKEGIPVLETVSGEESWYIP